MKTKTFLCASALAFSGALWSDNISVQPFVDYETRAKGTFVAGESAGRFKLEDGPGVGVDVAVKNFLDNKNLRWKSGIRYRSSSIDSLKYEKVDGSKDRAMLDSLNNAATIDGTMSRISVETGLWRDIDLGSNFKPYVGGGVQYTHVHVDSHTSFNIEGPDGQMLISGVTHEEGDGGGIGFVFGTGINYQASDRIAVEVKYNYRYTQLELKFEGDEMDGNELTIDSLSSHAIMAGIRIIL